MFICFETNGIDSQMGQNSFVLCLNWSQLNWESLSTSSSVVRIRERNQDIEISNSQLQIVMRLKKLWYWSDKPASWREADCRRHIQDVFIPWLLLTMAPTIVLRYQQCTSFKMYLSVAYSPGAPLNKITDRMLWLVNQQKLRTTT